MILDNESAWAIVGMIVGFLFGWFSRREYVKYGGSEK